MSIAKVSNNRTLQDAGALRTNAPSRMAEPSSISRLTVALLNRRRPKRQCLRSLINGPRASAARHMSNAAERVSVCAILSRTPTPPTDPAPPARNLMKSARADNSYVYASSSLSALPGHPED
jgi:hypothetical protein